MCGLANHEIFRPRSTYAQLLATRSMGFTLIEVLLALAIMAMMAVLSWRGVDTMLRSQDNAQARVQEVAGLQAALTQWGNDLDAIYSDTSVQSMDWSGKTLRLTRSDLADPAAGVRVVAWTLRDVNGQSHWLRWQSAALRNREAWMQAWQAAAVWAEGPDDNLRQMETVIAPVEAWSLYYYREDSWSNPLSSPGNANSVQIGQATRNTTNNIESSSANQAVTPPYGLDSSIPRGVRLVLKLPAKSALGGILTRDWAKATEGGGKA